MSERLMPTSTENKPVFFFFGVRVNCLGNVSGRLPRLMPGFLKSSLERLSVDAGENFWLTMYTTGLGTLWD